MSDAKPDMTDLELADWLGAKSDADLLALATVDRMLRRDGSADTSPRISHAIADEVAVRLEAHRRRLRGW